MDLICEGRCNGSKIRRIDVEIAAWRKDASTISPPPNRPDLPKGERLETIGVPLYADCVYTPHRSTRTSRYVCEICEQERTCRA